MNVAREGSTGRILLALLAAGAAIGGLAPSRAEAQCQVVSAPSLFDQVTGGSSFQGRPDRIAVGGPAGARRLLVRYNYGFIAYDLASPAAPQMLQQKDLRFGEAYPVGGDGQTRAGMISLSSDGARALVPWGAAGFGTVVLSPTPYSGGGEYLPSGSKTKMTAAVKSGNRYLAFSSTSAGALWVADVTTVQRGVPADQENQNQIASWPYTGPAFGGVLTILTAVESASRAYLLAASETNVTVIDVSAPGPAGPGITNGFSHRTYAISELGLSGKLKALSAALHPTDGGLYLVGEGTQLATGVLLSNGVTLTRIQPPSTPGGTFGSAELKGTHVPDAAVRRAMPGSLLLSFDTELAAIFVEGEGDQPGGPLHLHVRPSTDFGQNRAAGVKFTSPTQLEALEGFRSTGGTFHLYMGLLGVGAYAASISCSLTPTPAEGTLTVEKVPATGASVVVPDDGTAFVGDELRIRPTFAPADTVQPVTDWRFDYAYHEGNPNDASATSPFLVDPDIPFTQGNYPSQLTLIGPCDPSQDVGANPSTGASCWASVLASSDFASPDPAAGTQVQIPLAFEVRNALNGASSDLTKHRINWKVPRALLKSASILSGDPVEDDSEGTPDRSGISGNAYRWYFASLPVGETGGDVLTLKADCTGPVCDPGLPQQGTYRYWASVPYRNGFRTPDCPGLEGVTCVVPAAPTVSVTDVVLGFSVPAGGNVGAQSLSIASSSKKGTSSTPCGGTSGFTYDLCTASGGSCPEGSYDGVGFVATNPFPAAGSGTVSIPMPPEGTYGVRIRYSYTTTGSCDAPLTATWPDQGQWAPLTVVGPVPVIKLFNSTGTTELPKWAGSYSLTTGQTARAYAYVNDVRETALPQGASIFHTNVETGQVTQIGTAQGASFSIATRGDYIVTLRGYGVDATAGVAVEALLGSPPLVTSLTFSKTAPAVSEIVTISCQATPGTYAIGSYRFTFGDEQEVTGVSASTTHAWISEGTKAASCTAYDVNDVASTPLTAYIDVGGPSSGPTVTSIDLTPQYLRPGVIGTLTCNATAPAGRLVAGYEFDFGDSTPLVDGASNVATHTYGTPGTYQATCRAYDWSGRSGFLQRAVAVLEPTYSLSVGKPGSGSGLVYSVPAGLISCGSVCSTTLEGGSTITLEALPSSDSRFAGWSESTCSGLGPCTVVMTTIRDITATFVPKAGALFYPVAPCRLFDTRESAGPQAAAPALASGETRTFTVGTRCGLSSSTDRSLAVNQTVTQPTADGELVLYPGDLDVEPVASNVSYRAGITRANNGLLELSRSGDGTFKVHNRSAGSVHFILDVSGRFQ